MLRNIIQNNGVKYLGQSRNNNKKNIFLYHYFFNYHSPIQQIPLPTQQQQQQVQYRYISSNIPPFLNETENDAVQKIITLEQLDTNLNQTKSYRKTYMIDLNNDLADDDDNNNKMKNVLKDIRLKAASRDRLLLVNNNNKNNKDEIEILINEIGWLKTREFLEDDDDSIITEYLPNEGKYITDMSNFIFKTIIGYERLEHQPIDLRNAFAFYYGHISAFTDIIALQLPAYEEERIKFERGVDPDVDNPDNIDHRHSERHQIWPSPNVFEKYANDVELALVDLIKENGMTRESVLVTEHADMHYETLMYNLNGCMDMSTTRLEDRNDGINDGTVPIHPFATFMTPIETKRIDDSLLMEYPYVAIPTTTKIKLGINENEFNSNGFGWDIELPIQTQDEVVNAFLVGQLPVTNNEFLEFIQDNGYEREEFWETNAYEWIKRESIQHPKLWFGASSSSSSFGVRTVCDGIVMNDKSGDWPAIVTLFEANAYCNWKGNGARIMTEEEYHAIFNNNDELYAYASKYGNNNWKYRSCVPVGTMNDGIMRHQEDDDNNKKIYDLVGNGWEWTSSILKPLDGFESMKDYPEYSSDFFDGKHYVVKGASSFTGKSNQRLSFRNWYQGNYPYVHAKFRICM